MKISVIIPAYNEELSIKKAIKSVLKSSYTNFEIIVVDNGSTDSTARVVKGFKSKKIRLFYYDQKRGPAAARNYGAKKSKGEILFFLDADDWVNKDTLKSINESFNKYKVKAICGSRKPLISKKWNVIWAYEFISQGITETRIVNNTPACPYIFKKSFFKEIGGFNESSYYFEDELLANKLREKQINVLITNKINYYSDMGSTFNDFFKRAKNIGKGVVISKNYQGLIRILLMTLFFSYSFFKIDLFIIYYLSFSLYWFNRSKRIIIALLAPILFILKKFIGTYFIIKELLNKS